MSYGYYLAQWAQYNYWLLLLLIPIHFMTLYNSQGKYNSHLLLLASNILFYSIFGNNNPIFLIYLQKCKYTFFP